MDGSVNLFGVEHGEIQTVVIFLTPVGHETPDTGILQRVQNGLDRDVTGEIPVLRIALFRLRHMAENTMQNDV